MDITHPGQYRQLIFYFDVFVEFVLNILHSLFHILELILFHVVIYLMYLIPFIYYV